MAETPKSSYPDLKNLFHHFNTDDHDPENNGLLSNLLRMFQNQDNGMAVRSYFNQNNRKSPFTVQKNFFNNDNYNNLYEPTKKNSFNALESQNISNNNSLLTKRGPQSMYLYSLI